MTQDGKRSRLTKVKVTEISLVDRPANQHANVILAKRDDGVPSGTMLFDDALARMTGPRLFDEIVKVEKVGNAPISFEAALTLAKAQPMPVATSAPVEIIRLPETVAIGKRQFDESKIARAEDGRFTFKNGREIASRTVQAVGRLASSAAAAAGESLKSVRATRVNPVAGGGVQVEIKGKDPTGKVVYIRHQVRAEHLNPDNAKGAIALTALEEGLRIFGHAEVQPTSRRTTVRRVREQDQPDFREGRAYDYATAAAGEAPYRPASETTAAGGQAPGSVSGQPVDVGGVSVPRSGAPNMRVVSEQEPFAHRNAAVEWGTKAGNRASFQGALLQAHTYKDVLVPSGPAGWVSEVHRRIRQDDIPKALRPAAAPQPAAPPSPTPSARLNTGNRTADLQALAPRRTQEDKDFIARFGQANQTTPPPGSPKWDGEIAPAITHNGVRIPEGPTDWQAKAKDFVDGRKGRDGDGDGILNEGKTPGQASTVTNIASPEAIRGDSRPLADRPAPETASVSSTSAVRGKADDPIELAHKTAAETIHINAHIEALDDGHAPGSRGYERAYERLVNQARDQLEEKGRLPSGQAIDIDDLQEKLDHLYREQAIENRFAKADQARDLDGRFASSQAAKGRVRRAAARAIMRFGGKPQAGETKAAYAARTIAGLGAETVVNILSHSGMPDVAAHAGPIAEHTVRYLSALAGKIQKAETRLPGPMKAACDHCLDCLRHAAGAQYDAHTSRRAA